MDRQTGIGIKDGYLLLTFKIVLLESSEVKTDYLVTNGRKIAQTEGQKIVHTDGHNVLNISIWCHTFQLKKYFFNRSFRTALDTDRRDFVWLSVHPFVWTDTQKVQKIGI